MLTRTGGELLARGLRFLSPPGPRARLQIFTYHRVLSDVDVFAQDVTREEFRRQTSWISEMCTVLPLSEAVTRLAEGTLPASAAAITFDDGYQNNLSHALPILAEHQVPATIFLAANALVDGIMWNDLIIEGVRGCRGEFEFCIGDETVQISRDSSSADLLMKLKYLAHARRYELCVSFFKQATRAEIPRLMLTPEEVAQCDTPLISFGAHSLSHPILSNLDQVDCAREIIDSKCLVEQWTGRSADIFAYPNGKLGRDFGIREMQIAKDAGFKAAVATNWGAARNSDNPFALPRFTPWDKTEMGFKTRILKTNIAR